MRAEDALFLYAETPAVPQQVGAVVLVEGGQVELGALRAAIAERVDAIPELRRRVLPARSRWSRPRWVVDPFIDVGNRIHEVPLSAPGEGPLDELVARFFAEPLDPACSPWEMLLVPGSPATGLHTVVVKVHHALGDSFTLIGALGGLFDEARGRLAERVPGGATSEEGRAATKLARAGRVLNGLAGMLRAGRAPTAPIWPAPPNGCPGPPLQVAERARSGPPASGPPASGALTEKAEVEATAGGPTRQFVHFSLPARTVTKVASQFGTSIPDLLLALLADAISRRRAGTPGAGTPGANAGTTLRVMVPHSVRRLARRDLVPGAGARGSPASNRTAGALLDLPVLPMTFTDRVTAVRELHARCLRRGDPEAAAFVLRTMNLLPAVLQRRWACSFYTGAWLGMIVSVFPGVRRPCRLLGEGITAVYPVLALAKGTDLAMGAMTWGSSMSVSLLGSAPRAGDLASLAKDIEQCFYDCSEIARAGPSEHR